VLAHGHGPHPVLAGRFAPVQLRPRGVLVRRQPHSVVNVQLGLRTIGNKYNDGKKNLNKEIDGGIIRLGIFLLELLRVYVVK